LFGTLVPRVKPRVLTKPRGCIPKQVAETGEGEPMKQEVEPVHGALNSW
jgi:hypothetical protein